MVPKLPPFKAMVMYWTGTIADMKAVSFPPLVLAVAVPRTWLAEVPEEGTAKRSVAVWVPPAARLVKLPPEATVKGAVTPTVPESGALPVFLMFQLLSAFWPGVVTAKSMTLGVAKAKG